MVRTLLIASVSSLAAITVAPAPPAAVWWGQWGRNAQHHGAVAAVAQAGTRIHANVVYDPFTDQERSGAGGNLLVHYQAPLISGNDVYMEFKTGQFSTIRNWEAQTWGERKYSWVNGELLQQWEFTSDWKPVPFSSAQDGPKWEPVFHAALTNGAVYVSGFTGTVWKLDRATGRVLSHIAGARSVVSTLWPVRNATSTALMQHFYENLTRGQSVAEALARGKTATVSEFGASALPTVAAFQLVGPGDHRIALRSEGRRISERSGR